MHSAGEQPYLESDDLLWRQLKTIPAFRALLRAVESRFYRQVTLPEPILDVGCGDGHFAQMTFDRPLTAGIDPWWGPLQGARASGQYRQVLQSMGHRMPFPDHTFASAISNSVLEHIPDVQPVLNEVSRVLQPGGRFVITMPSHRFTERLGGAALLTTLGMESMAERYRRFFNKISRHAHTDSAEIWATRLAQAGFTVERWQYYFSTQALRALERGHAQGMPAAVMKALTGHWIVAPWESSLRRTERWTRPFYEEEAPADGAYVLFILRKAADGPVAAALPPARPFTVAEMEATEPAPAPVLAEAVAEPAVSSPGAAPPSPSPSPPPPVRDSGSAPVPRLSPLFWRGLLVFFSLASAALGQVRLGSNPDVPGSGLGWFAISGLLLLPLLWRPGPGPGWAWRWPRLDRLPLRRWLYPAALLLSISGYLLVSGMGQQRPLPALLLWFTAIILALIALDRPSRAGSAAAGNAAAITRGRVITTSILIFLAALLPRVLNLRGLPFILNGTEASLGLDLLSVAEGTLRNPFATGWMTNPTLPAFLLAPPISLFGPSVIALRLPAALAGALTVIAVYWLGRKIWGTSVAAAAAILLGGSHFHVHYSRTGLFNIWDPLWVLLALGLIAIAWRTENPVSRRRLWLGAGTAVGSGAYFFTASRLLPLMLVVLLLWALLFDRRALLRNGRDAVFALALAFLMALPLLLYYNDKPAIFAERVDAVGIFSGQSDWLAQEAERTGVSQVDILQRQFWRAALAFNSVPDRSPSYRPTTPLLTFPAGLLFVLGLMIALARMRRLRYALLLVWIGVTLIFGGALLLDPPQSHRLVIAAPALALLAGIALATLGEAVIAGASRRERAADALRGVLLLVAFLVAANELNFYFGRFPEQRTFADRNTEVAQRMADYLNTLEPDNWTAYFYGPPHMYVSFPTIPFLASDFYTNGNLYDVPPPPQAALPPAPTSRIAFFFLPERSGELDEVEVLYPGGSLQPFPGRYADPFFPVRS